MPTISVRITCTRPHWVAIDDADLAETSIDLAEGEHFLVWGILGRPGDTFKAKLKDGDREVCVVDWAIPDGSTGWTGDFAQFTV